MKARQFTLLASLFALATPLVTIGGARADAEQMQQLVPDVQRPLKTERTYVFSRSQLKYGLEDIDYLNRWVDRPLFVDPKLRGEETKPQTIYYPSYRRIQEIVKQYGLDGFAFFPETSGRTLEELTFLFEGQDKIDQVQRAVEKQREAGAVEVVNIGLSGDEEKGTTTTDKKM